MSSRSMAISARARRSSGAPVDQRQGRKDLARLGGRCRAADRTTSLTIVTGSSRKAKNHWHAGAVAARPQAALADQRAGDRHRRRRRR